MFEPTPKLTTTLMVEPGLLWVAERAAVTISDSSGGMPDGSLACVAVILLEVTEMRELVKRC